ncbi:ATPase family gene 2 protein homolog A [Culicoides brevitarsis]|uniref:ATPase family gene 2 protein homolog A n=1 Tax=Culicoides brevitarsis TaxID=469753 RepID=UPI00307C0D07
MPPKSASKKEKPLWFTCEKCSLLIMGQPAPNNHQNCDLTSTASYITTGSSTVFKPNKVETKTNFDEESSLASHQLNNLLFLNLQVMRLAKFVIGEPLLIKNNEDFSVKNAWPVNDKSLDVVRLTKNELWRYETGNLTIEKFGKKLNEAKNVVLRCLNESKIDGDLKKNLLRVVKCEFKGHALRKGLELRLVFMNKPFVFEVHEISSQNSLSEKLATLSIDDKTPEFVKIGNSTEIQLFSKDETQEISSKKVKEEIFIGGLSKQRQEIEEIIAAKQTRAGLTKGILLHGSPGCGKTLLVKSLLADTSIKHVQINSSEIFSRYYGETEANLTSNFEKVKENYPALTLVVVEDIHNLCPKADNTDIGRRVTSSFITLMDQLPANALIIATTNQIENLSANLRRSGRIDYEIEVSVPSPDARNEILDALLRKHQLSISAEDVSKLGLATHGYTGADLESLITKTLCMNPKNTVSIEDLMQNLTIVKPSAMREIQIESPNIKWSDIGGQADLKLKLQQAVEWPIKHPETFKRLGITPPRGLLMFGPPGCSKTMIAKALATESSLNFLSIKGSELFSMWVGESEKAVRKLFQKAREVAPAIIFFDEIDAIGGERGGEGSSNSVKERVLAQILTEIDGVHALKDVTIVAATNRPDLIDKALMRPGRLDRVIYVGLPDSDTRRDIFNIKLQKMPIHENVTLENLVERTEGYSGAEIQAVCQEAALHALEISFEATHVTQEDFDFALKFVQPRTSKALLELYENYLNDYKFK